MIPDLTMIHSDHVPADRAFVLSEPGIVLVNAGPITDSEWVARWVTWRLRTTMADVPWLRLPPPGHEPVPGESRFEVAMDPARVVAIRLGEAS